MERTIDKTEVTFLQELTVGMAEAGYSAEVQEVVKVNESYRGICIRRKDSPSIAATMHLDQIFAQRKEGKSMEDVVREVVQEAEKSLEGAPKVKALAADTLDLKSIRAEAVCTEKNLDLLRTVPHIEICDLSIIFRKDLGKDASTIITKQLAASKNLDIEDPEKLRQLMQIVAIHHAAVIRPLRSVLEEMGAGIPAEDDVPIYVVTTAGSPYGSAALVYPGLLKSLAKNLGKSYWILPSSIYELLIVPDDQTMHEEDMYSMVCEINRTQVRPEERLSDNAYYFDSEKGILRDHFGRVC